MPYQFTETEADAAWKAAIEHVGRIVVLWSRVENAVDLLLTLSGTPPGGRRGGFTSKLATLEGRLAGEAGVAQPVPFGEQRSYPSRSCPMPPSFSQRAIPRGFVTGRLT